MATLIARLRTRRDSRIVVVGVVLLILVVLLLFWAVPRDDALGQADALFLDGHYLYAYQHYRTLAGEQPTPELALRMGMLHAIRGEYPPAKHALRAAMLPSADPTIATLARFYLGYVLAQQDDMAQADQTWQPLIHCASDPCWYAGLAHVLRADVAWQQSDYAAATNGYRTALRMPLPSEWAHVAAYRLALIRAADDPDAALREWQQQRTMIDALPPPPDGPFPFLAPLLPATEHDMATFVTLLEHEEHAERAQLLGQHFLTLQRYDLAEAQFAQAATAPDHTISAATYDAYTRWRTGHDGAALSRLRRLVAQHPERPALRTLLIVAYLARNDLASAQTELATLIDDYPNLPETALAQGAFAFYQSDYVAATYYYEQTLLSAPPDRRADYAMLVARFHLFTTFELCEAGRTAADLAVAAAPTHADAWVLLAAIAYYCHDLDTAVHAAEQALALDQTAEASFYLGAALAANGEPDRAYPALVLAADAAPASIWRQHAEELLAQLASLPH